MGNGVHLIMYHVRPRLRQSESGLEEAEMKIVDPAEESRGDISSGLAGLSRVASGVVLG